MTRKRSSPLRNILAVAACAAALVVGVGAWRTYTVTGDAAVAVMDSDERALLAKLSRLDHGMSRAQVEALLGPAARWTGLGAGEYGTWETIPGGQRAGLRIYFDSGKASRLKWMKLGAFTYEASLPAPSSGR